jgi:prepilin-type N-terminal cleavage/methylation domain-containing protein
MPIRHRLDKTRIEQLRRKPGFTLLELTIVIMISGILAAVAVPVYSNSLHQFRVEVASQRIAQDIAIAQTRARQISTTCTVSFSDTNNTCDVGGFSSLDRSSQPYQVLFSQSPYLVDVHSLVTASAPTTPLKNVSVVFNKFGMPDQGISVSVRAGSFAKQIDVEPLTGRVSIR